MPRPRILLLLTVLALTACGDDGAGLPAHASPTGVVLITADDLGWRDLGRFGNANLATPHLDRLADEGVWFANAFVVSSSCSPSRATIATGQYPHTHGLTGLAHRFPERSLAPGTPTLASRLRDAGYRTAIQGKWHLAFPEGPEPYGYDESLSGFVESTVWTDLDPLRATEFIRRNAGGRFYLEVNSRHNHRAIDGDFYFDPRFPVDPDAVVIPDYWHLPDWPEIREEVARFWSQTQRVDQIVGEVLRTLDDLGLAETTLVLFVSDNGSPFPGMKTTPYDRGVGTPLIVRWPVGIANGGRHEGLASTVDILPTLLEAVDLDVPGDVQGRSLMRALRDPARPPLREAVFLEMTDHAEPLPMRGVRTDGWKYIANLSEDPYGLDQLRDEEWALRLAELPDQPWAEPRVPEELYRLADDPDEQVDLAGDPAARSARDELRAILREHLERTDDPALAQLFPG